MSSSIRFPTDMEKPKTQIRSAYEHQINNRIQSEASLPKVGFSAKEVYDQVKTLNAKIPFWTSENQNPINQFVPSQE